MRGPAACPSAGSARRPTHQAATPALLQVGDKVRAEGVAHAEGSYKWRVTRLELESVVAAAQPAPRTASLPSAGGPARYGARTGALTTARPGHRGGGMHAAASWLCKCTAAGAPRNRRAVALRPAPAPAEQERQKLREEAAGKVYNAMAPPVAAYTSEVAIASVETSLAGGAGAASQAAAAAKALEEKRALLARSAAELDEEARKRAEQVRAPCWLPPGHAAQRVAALALMLLTSRAWCAWWCCRI